MRIATWNVNSLKARHGRPREVAASGPSRTSSSCRRRSSPTTTPRPCRSRCAGYELVHHGEGRWNGVAIASRVGSRRRRHELRRRAGPRQRLRRDAASARRTSTRSTRHGWCPRSCGGIRVVCLYAPNGRVVGSPFYDGQAALVRAAAALARRGPLARRAARPRRRLQRDAVRRGRLGRGQGARRHARVGARARGARRRSATGAWSTPTGSRTPTQPATSRGGTTGPACSTATRACGSTCCTRREPVAERIVWAEIDREARKGPPDPVRPRAGRHRPRRAGQAVRRRLGRGAREDRGPDATERPEEPGAGPVRGGPRGTEQGRGLTRLSRRSPPLAPTPAGPSASGR